MGIYLVASWAVWLIIFIYDCYVCVTDFSPEYVVSLAIASVTLSVLSAMISVWMFMRE